LMGSNAPEYARDGRKHRLYGRGNSLELVSGLLRGSLSD